MVFRFPEPGVETGMGHRIRWTAIGVTESLDDMCIAMYGAEDAMEGDKQSSPANTLASGPDVPKVASNDGARRPPIRSSFRQENVTKLLTMEDYPATSWYVAKSLGL